MGEYVYLKPEESHVREIARKKSSLTDSGKPILGSCNPLQLKQYQILKQVSLDSKSDPKNFVDYRTKMVAALKVKYENLLAENPEEEKTLKASWEADKAKLNNMSNKEGLSLKRPKLASVDDLRAPRKSDLAKPVNELFKSFGITWLGGHLLKAVWGGSDNMMNVVAWDKEKAEKMWTQNFEDPLETEFMLEPEVNSAIVDIRVIKEDEILPPYTQPFLNPSNYAQSYLMKQTEAKRWEINRVAERIPMEVEGRYDINTGKRGGIHIDKGSVGYDRVERGVLPLLKGYVEGMERMSQLCEDEDFEMFGNNPEAARAAVLDENLKERSSERLQAMAKEYDTLQPESFFQNIEDESAFEDALGKEGFQKEINELALKKSELVNSIQKERRRCAERGQLDMFVNFEQLRCAQVKRSEDFYRDILKVHPCESREYREAFIEKQKQEIRYLEMELVKIQQITGSDSTS